MQICFRGAKPNQCASHDKPPETFSDSDSDSDSDSGQRSGLSPGWKEPWFCRTPAIVSSPGPSHVVEATQGHPWQRSAIPPALQTWVRYCNRTSVRHRILCFPGQAVEFVPQDFLQGGPKSRAAFLVLVRNCVWPIGTKQFVLAASFPRALTTWETGVQIPCTRLCLWTPTAH